MTAPLRPLSVHTGALLPTSNPLSATCCAVLAALCLGGAARVRANEPLPPPAEVTSCSPRRTFCAVSDPRANTTTVYRMRGDERGAAEWSMRGWLRNFHVLDDGAHLVAGTDETLLALDHDLSEPILRFYRRGALFRKVAFRSVVSRAQLTRTASRFAWGRYQGFNAKGQYELVLLDGTVVRFDGRTGKRIR